VIVRVEPGERQLTSPLGRTSPLLKLAVAIAWFVALFLTTAIAPPLVLAGLVLAAGLTLGRVPATTLVRSLAVLWGAALTIGVFNALFNAANADPMIAELVRIGPFRLTEPALAGGAGLAARVVAIAAVGVVFAQTTDATRLVDALVQQGRVPERFAYGALAAYQAIPRFAEDLATLRQARRIRGLRGEWHPRILVGLLVLAIRHGDRLALAMDARAFGSGSRSRYRIVRWGVPDVAVAVGSAAVLALLVVLAAG
jgi:energy-coupling factor transporter transmembrane protein EcfT